MARKTAHEAEKEANPIVGTQIPIQEGEGAYENFEKLAKRLFSGSQNKSPSQDDK